MVLRQAIESFENWHVLGLSVEGARHKHKNALWRRNYVVGHIKVDCTKLAIGMIQTSTLVVLQKAEGTI